MRKSKYQIHRIAVDAILEKNGKILMEKRDFNPFKGYYVLPGGHTDFGEHPAKTAERELWEETKIKTKAVKFIGAYYADSKKMDPRGPVISFAYKMKYISGKAKPDWESSSLVWIDKNKLPKKIGFNHREKLMDYLGKKHKKETRL